MSEGVQKTAHLKPGVTLYLVRHGETDWNKQARYQGQADIPLNETGRLQAARNGATLRTMLPAIAQADFVSSPLSRARETMEILRGEIGVDPLGFRQDPTLLELHYGHWEGHLASELPQTDPEGVAGKQADPFGWRPDGGESYADLMDRISAWINALDRTTVAVTHGGVSRVARGALLGLDRFDVPVLDVPQDKILVLRNMTMEWL
ncbi:MAG: histidine phosphatase family protein [Hyphomicrobium sp.]